MALFGDRLRELRKQSGFSQQELADRIDQTKQAVSQYERGVRKPDIDMLSALCDIFNVSMDYLMGKADVTVRFLTSDDLDKLSNPSKPLRTDEHILLEYYNQLNVAGKEAARERIKELTEIRKFTEKETSQNLSSGF